MEINLERTEINKNSLALLNMNKLKPLAIGLILDYLHINEYCPIFKINKKFRPENKVRLFKAVKYINNQYKEKNPEERIKHIQYWHSEYLKRRFALNENELISIYTEASKKK